MGLLDYLSITPDVSSHANKLVGVSTPPSPASNEEAALPDFDKAKQEIISESPAYVDYDKLIRDKGYYGAFLAMNKKPDFEAEEKRLRRSRELALLGDVANLGGQVFASGMGARRFAPIQPQVPQYNEKLQRLRDAQRAYDMDFSNKSLSMIFNDYNQKRADEYRNRQFEAASQKDAYNRQWDKYKYDADTEYKTNKDKVNAELKNRELEALEIHRRAIEVYIIIEKYTR